jgi:transposase
VRSPVDGSSTKKNLNTGDLVDTLAVAGRFDLTDEQWAVLEPLLPAPSRSGRPSLWHRRQLIDGIRWRVRTGAPWRDMPALYGSWAAAYGVFRRWQRAGVWHQVLTALQALAEAEGRITWDVSVDSTIARAHQHAAGARKRGICRPSRLVGSPSSLMITRWVGRGAGGPRSCIWGVSRGRSRCRSC